MDLEDQYDKLYRYCYFRVRDVQTAEDLVQETFLRWLDHYPGQREREALPTLYTIARNLCVDVTRQRETLPLQETDQVAADPAGTLVERWDLNGPWRRSPPGPGTAAPALCQPGAPAGAEPADGAVPVCHLSKVRQAADPTQRGIARGGENMNRRLKRALAASFSPPPPREKRFFSGPCPSRTSPPGDLSLEPDPLSAEADLAAVLRVLLPAVWGGSCMNPNVLWITAALLPFVALLAVTEGTRSAVYGMEELELATRFSLKSVLLARLCLVGSLHAALLLCLTLLCRGDWGGLLWTDRGVSFGPLPSHRLWRAVAVRRLRGGRWSMGRRCWQYW